MACQSSGPFRRTKWDALKELDGWSSERNEQIKGVCLGRSLTFKPEHVLALTPHLVLSHIPPFLQGPMFLISLQTRSYPQASPFNPHPNRIKQPCKAYSPFPTPQAHSSQPFLRYVSDLIGVCRTLIAISPGLFLCNLLLQHAESVTRLHILSGYMNHPID